VPTFVWILLLAALWLVLGAVVAVVVGRMVRQRDRQVPHDLPGDINGIVPDPRDGTDQPSMERSTTRRDGGAPPA